MAGMTAKVTGIGGRHAEEERRHDVRGGEGDGEPDGHAERGEHHALPHHEAHHPRGAGAERDADADLARATGDRYAITP
jgi:hypothetical protein